MSASDFLTQTATIQRWTAREASSGNDWEASPAYVNAETGVACKIEHKSVQPSMGPGGLQVGFMAVGYFDKSVDLRPDAGSDARADRIVVDGATYEVLGTMAQTPRNETQKAMLKRV